MIYPHHHTDAQRSPLLNWRSACLGLVLLAYGADAQDVPTAVDPILPTNPTIRPPDPCDTQPCFRAAPDSSAQPQPYLSTSPPPTSGGSPTNPSMNDMMSSIDNGTTTYEVAAPFSNAAAKSLPNSNPLKIVNFPEIPKAAGYVLSTVQVGVKCYQGAQTNGADGCIAEGGKEAVLATARQ